MISVIYSVPIYLHIRVPIVLVGNKKDLHMQRVVTFEMGKKLANEWNVSFVESSAKQNEVGSGRWSDIHVIVVIILIVVIIT